VTPVGHSLAGLAIGVLGAPRGAGWRARACFAAAFVVLPNLPDAPLPGWGHDDYTVSHSLLVNLALAAVVARVISLSPAALRAVGGWRGLLAGVLAWQSHFLLDSFYNHHKGVAIFWPASTARLDLALPWFRTLPGWALDAVTLRIVVIEAAFYGAVLAAAIAARVVEERMRAARR
jgi:hypothetical protein